MEHDVLKDFIVKYKLDKLTSLSDFQKGELEDYFKAIGNKEQINYLSSGQELNEYNKLTCLRGFKIGELEDYLKGIEQREAVPGHISVQQAQNNYCEKLTCSRGFKIGELEDYFKCVEQREQIPDQYSERQLCVVEELPSCQAQLESSSCLLWNKRSNRQSDYSPDSEVQLQEYSQENMQLSYTSNRQHSYSSLTQHSPSSENSAISVSGLEYAVPRVGILQSKSSQINTSHNAELYKQYSHQRCYSASAEGEKSVQVDAASGFTGYTFSPEMSQSLHSRESPYAYRCHLCQESFMSLHFLMSHMQLHPETKSLKCEVCGKIFREKRDLQIHFSTHKPGKSYSWMCHFCGLRCDTHIHLWEHEKTHSGGRVEF